MKSTSSSRRKILFSLLLVLSPLILAGLQSCSGSNEITIKQTPGVVMASAEAYDGEGLLGNIGADGRIGYSLAEISDTSFVLGTRVESEIGRLICFNKTLGEKWSTTFALHEDERGMVWYKNAKIAVITHYSEDDTLFLTGRHFDAASGKLLDSNRIAAIPAEDGYSLSYEMSPDSSKLFAVVSMFIDRIDRNTDVESYLFLPLPHSLKAEPAIQRNVTNYSWLPQSVAVNNRGDIFYATYMRDDNRYELVRLMGSATDTLVFTPPVPDGDDPLRPASITITPSDNTTILAAWNQIDDGVFDDRDFRGIYVRRFDFARREVGMNTVVGLDAGELMPLIDDDEIKDFNVHTIHSLPSGNILLTGHQLLKDVIVHRDPNGGSFSSTSYTVGPILVMMLDQEGKKVWKTLLKREGDLLDDYPVEGRPVCIPGSDYVHLFYRNRETEAGLVYTQVSLRDGTVSTQALPLSYSENSLFLPGCTLLNKDKSAVLVGLEEEEAKIVRLPLR